MKKLLTFLMFFLLATAMAQMQAETVTVSQTSFSAIAGNVNGDANVSYSATQGKASTAPAVNNSQIRVYQNGGLFTVGANYQDKVRIKSITLGSAMATSVTYSVDGGANSEAKSISANGTITVNDLDCWYVTFTCKGTTSSSRLYVNKLSVTYEIAGDTPSTTYSVTVADNIANGTVTASPTSAKEGDKVTLTATPATGYEFGSWSITPSTVEVDANNQFTMPASNVTVSATFNEVTPGPTPSGDGYDFTFITHPSGWPIAKESAAAGTYTYNLNGKSYSFTHTKEGTGIYLAGTSGTSGYLLLSADNMLGLPAIEGYKLVKVVGQLNNQGTPSTSSRVSITDGTNTVTGGDSQTWSEKGGNYTYSLSGTTANTVYYLAVSYRNCQMINLSLTYEKEGDTPTPSGPSIEAESALNLTAAGGDGTFNVTWTNAAEMDVNLYTDASCTTPFTGSWFQTQLNKSDNNVYYIVASNAELTPRTVYMRLYALGEDGESEATKVVTVTQAGKDPAPLAVITAESTLSVPYTGVEEGSTFNVTWENAESMDVYLYTDEGCTTPFTGSWFLAEINKDNNNVYYIAEANTETAPRTVYMQLIALNADATETSKVVTVTQEGVPAPKYAITIVEPANGTVTADKTEAAEGEEVTLTVTPATGYELDALTVTGASGEVTVADGKFTMPAEVVTVSATFKESVTPTVAYINLAIDETTTASADKLEWVKDEVTVTADKAKSTTDANNYYPGTSGKTYTSTRFYSGSTLTFAPASGKSIASIEYFATSTSYATYMVNSTWGNATAKANGTTVTITPTDGTEPVVANIGGTTGGTAFNIYFGTPTPAAKLTGIEIAGYTTTFNVGDTFSFGGTVTATYEDKNTKNVTSKAEFSDYDMSTAGTQTVTVSYTEGDVTKTATYSITVNAVTPPEPVGDEVYTLVTDLASLKNNSKIIIATNVASNDNYYALSTTQNRNNFAATTVTLTGSGNDKIITNPGEDVRIVNLVRENDNEFYFNIGTTQSPSYLRASSGSSNYMSAGAKKDDDSKATITLGDNNVASIVFKSSTNRNVMQFNLQTPPGIVSCYSSASQTAISLYKLQSVKAPTFSIPSGAYHDAQSVTLSSATAGTSIYYTLDGSAPSKNSTLYTSAIAINEGTVTIKAIAVTADDEESDVATATYTIIPALINGEFELVTSANSADAIEAGKEYIIVSIDNETPYALSTENSFLNGRPEDSEGKTRVSPDHRKAVADVELLYDDYVAKIKPSVSVLTLEAVEVAEGQAPKFKLNSAMGYLIPKADIRPEPEGADMKDDAGLLVTTTPARGAEVATITIDDNNVAHIVFDANTGREIRYNFNDNGNRFSAYKPGSSNILNAYLYYREAQPQSYLVDIEANGLDGHNYIIKDELQVVHAKGNVLWAKDNADSYAKRENVWTAEGVNNYLSGEYSQNNWIRIILPAGTEGEKYAGKMITAGSVNGTYHGYRNLFHTITVSGDLSVSGNASTYTPNTYCMANFWDENTYDYVIASTGNKFFFMNPKVEEVCTITEAIWQGSNTFVVPANTTITSGGQEVHLNSGDLKGAFKVNWEYNDAGQGVTTEQLLNYLGSNNDQRFKFNGAVTKVDKAVAQKAPAKVLGSTGLNVDGQNQYYEVFALDMALDNHIVTEVKDVDVAGREVKSVRFYDIAGRARSEAQSGINIVVTEYTDGTHSTAKMVR